MAVDSYLGGGGVILGIQSDCGECVPKSIDNEKHFMFIYSKENNLIIEVEGLLELLLLLLLLLCEPGCTLPWPLPIASMTKRDGKNCCISMSCRIVFWNWSSFHNAHALHMANGWGGTRACKCR